MNHKVRELGQHEAMPVGWAPVQSSARGAVDREIAEAAYIEYARRYGTDQSITRLCERGGFSWSELVELLYARMTTPDAGREEA